MKITFNAFILSCLILSFLSCKNTDEPAPFGTVDFSYAFKAGSQNTVNFTAVVTGSYELLEWNFGADKTKQDVTQTEYYFPFKGSYKVTLSIWNKGKSIATTKTIDIPINDPNYNGPALVWSDEFDGNNLNTTNWTPETNIRFNNELQSYQADGNHFVAGGYLTITAKKIDENKQFGSYSSARLMSKTKREFKYGRMEIRAKLPKGTGTWPAIWMLGKNIDAVSWPTCGELDIMEYVGYNPHWVKGSIHCAAYFAGNSRGGDFEVPDEDQFHVYGMNWTATKVEYYVDDRTKPYFTYSPDPQTSADWPFNQPFFFILNVAIGGDWGGAKGIDNTIFPVSMVVDYVRVYALE